MANYLNQPAQKTADPVLPANPFSDLPALMKYIIDSEVSGELNRTVEQGSSLTEQQGDRMMDIIRKIIFKTITPAELVATIQKDLELGAPASQKLALDLLGRRFLPMEWYLGPVQPLIQELGGDVNEFLAEARKNYPEVYAPKTAPGTPSGTQAVSSQGDFHLVENFDEWIQTPKGKAEILLRLTNLSMQADQAMQAGKMTEPDGQALLRDLDAVSYAINTQDLNQFETHSMRRQVEKILAAVQKAA